MRCIHSLAALICLTSLARADDALSLAAQLRDPSTDKAMAAATALRNLGADAAPAVPALIDALQDHRHQPGSFLPVNESVSSRAFSALVKIGGPAVPALITELDQSDASRLESALYVLRSMREAAEPARERIVALVKGHDSGRIRLAAYRAWLEVERDPARVLAVSRDCLEDADPDVCYHALVTLQPLQELPAAVGELVGGLLKDERYRTKYISDHFADQTPLRADAARFFAEQSRLAPIARTELIEMMRADELPRCRIEASRTLALIDKSDTEPIDRLVDMLLQMEGGSGEAVWALADIGPRAGAALGEIRRRLRDRPATEEEAWGKEPLRSGCVRTLRAIAGGESSAELLDLLKTDLSDLVRQAAAEELGELPDLGPTRQQAIEALLHAAQQDESYSVRYHAIRSLRPVGASPELVRTTLERMLDGDDEQRRIEAAIGLEEMGREAIASLEKLERAANAAASDREREVMTGAVEAVRKAR